MSTTTTIIFGAVAIVAIIPVMLLMGFIGSILKEGIIALYRWCLEYSGINTRRRNNMIQEVKTLCTHPDGSWKEGGEDYFSYFMKSTDSGNKLYLKGRE